MVTWKDNDPVQVPVISTATDDDPDVGTEIQPVPGQVVEVKLELETTVPGEAPC